jgi:hypothetical protein
MKQLFYISGYWKDDTDSIFTYLLVSSYDSADNTYEEDNVFLYGYSEEELIEAIALGHHTANNYVITAYQIAHIHIYKGLNDEIYKKTL